MHDLIMMDESPVRINNPKVSVIIIFFNADKFMDETIQSVLSQSLENWELLLVDDGSIDQSTALAKKYVQQYPGKIFYLEHTGHKNHGMSATRNLGLLHARGEYIAFIDADDVWMKEKLERQAWILDGHTEVDIVYGNTLRWYGWTGYPEDIEKDQLKNLGVTPNTIVAPPDLMKLYLTSGGYVPCMCSIMVRKKALLEVNGFEADFKGIYEDQVFYAKMALNYKVYIDEFVSSKYRQHPWSACHLAETRGEFDPYKPNKTEFVYLKWLKKYIRKTRINDPQLISALKIRLNLHDHPVFRRLKKYLG